MAGAPGSFDTDRWLVKGDLTGSFDHGNWRIGSTIGIIYVEELQQAYSTSGGTDVAARTARLRRLRFGPTISYTHTMDDGSTVSPNLVMIGNWDFANSGAVTLGGVTGAFGDLHASVKVGIRTRKPSGVTFDVEGRVDGLFDDAFAAWGGRASLSVPLN